MNIQLKEKIKTLPQEVFDFLTSAKSTELNILISSKYQLTLPQIKIFSDLIAQLFLREIPVAGLVESIKQLFGFSETMARQMACDIAGVRLLVVVDWLNADVAGLISSWGGDSARYQSYTEIQRQAVIKEAEWLAKELAEPAEETSRFADEDVDWEDREAKMKDLFSSHMMEMLQSDDETLLSDINESIFHLIFNIREGIKDELANLLLNNQEVLTNQRIVVDGRQVDATVANWLAYFISQKGSALFDAVTLSDFITNSPNAKFLDLDEKKLLSNLLIVYRNLKFFPDSLPSPDPKYWMIFPVTIPEEPIAKTVGVEANQAIIGLTGALPVAPMAQPKIFPKTVQSSPEEEEQKALRDSQIAEAESLLERYPAGSLERLALEEELTKLRQQE
jgi:hypothetical protein